MMENPYDPIGNTHGFTDPDGNSFPTSEDLMRGQMPDGSRPRLYSRQLYEGWEGKLPGDPGDKPPFARDAREINHRQRLSSIDALAAARRFQLRMVEAAEGIMDGKAPPEGVKPDVILRIGDTSARALVRTVKALDAQVAAAAEDASTVDERRMFLENRAVAVVLHTLLEMDQAFQDVGFGAWMPFRYPDQWLLFCNLMQKVLAANGLIHAKDPDVYRRLLEDTPEVESDGFKFQNPGKMPYNWARCWVNRGAATMAELKARLDEEVWNPSQPRAP
jgi:hypothetical protein